MFWIMGAEEIFNSLAKATDNPALNWISNQLTHPAWNGFHLYDLIFPLFLFMAGVATPFSVGRELEKGNKRKKVLLRVIRRGLILVLLGIIYNNGLHLRPFSDIRFECAGQDRIAYMFANIIFIYPKKHRSSGSGVLSSVTGSSKFTSRRVSMGDLTMEGNFASYIDRNIVRKTLSRHSRSRRVDVHHTGNQYGLLGILTGSFIGNSPFSGKKGVWMVVAESFYSPGIELGVSDQQKPLEQFFCLSRRWIKPVVFIPFLLCYRRAGLQKMGILFQSDWHEFHPHIYIRAIYQLGICNERIFPVAGTANSRAVCVLRFCHLLHGCQMGLYVFPLS
jgi:hypothetical protein